MRLQRRALVDGVKTRIRRRDDAQRAIREALTEAGFPDQVDAGRIVIAESPEAEAVYYDLYVPGDAPLDAHFIAKARVHADGTTKVEVFPENFHLVQVTKRGAVVVSRSSPSGPVEGSQTGRMSPTKCPSCGESADWRLGQTVTSGQLRWSRSLRCAHCGAAVEEDDVGLPPPDVRAELMARNGKWFVTVEPEQRTSAVKVLRQALGMEMKEAVSLMKSEGPLWSGTEAECAWLAMLLRDEGLRAKSRSVDTPPLSRKDVNEEMVRHSSQYLEGMWSKADVFCKLLSVLLQTRGSVDAGVAAVEKVTSTDRLRSEFIDWLERVPIKPGLRLTVGSIVGSWSADDISYAREVVAEWRRRHH